MAGPPWFASRSSNGTLRLHRHPHAPSCQLEPMGNSTVRSIHNLLQHSSSHIRLEVVGQGLEVLEAHGYQ